MSLDRMAEIAAALERCQFQVDWPTIADPHIQMVAARAIEIPLEELEYFLAKRPA